MCAIVVLYTKMRSRLLSNKNPSYFYLYRPRVQERTTPWLLKWWTIVLILHYHQRLVTVETILLKDNIGLHHLTKFLGEFSKSVPFPFILRP